MQLKTLWAIILKTIGVYFAFTTIQLFFFIGGLSIDMVFKGQTGTTFMNTTFMLLVEGVLAYMCLFRTDSLIRLFKLEESIPEKQLSVNIETKNVLRLGIAIIGIYSLSNSIPEFIGLLGGKASSNMFLISICKILLGLLMVIRNYEIESFISARQSKPRL